MADIHRANLKISSFKNDYDLFVIRHNVFNQSQMGNEGVNGGRSSG
jgi:hypothetical protein